MQLQESPILMLATRFEMSSLLQQVCNVVGKLLNGGTVEALHILQQAHVILAHKVDGHALAAEAPAAVQVVLWLCGQVKVDDQGHLHRAELVSTVVMPRKMHAA